MIKDNIFLKEELEELPLTYRKMDVKKTSEISELYTDQKFGISKKHYACFYIVEKPVKPFSNYINNGQ